MKTLFALTLIILLGIGGFYSFNAYIYNEKQGDTENKEVQADLIDVQPVSHASAVITWGDGVVYTDPTGGAAAYTSRPPASVIVVTDIHGDHLSTSTLAAAMNDTAVLVVPKAVADLLPDSLKTRISILNNGEKTVQNGFSIEAIPMYNLPESAESRHTKGRGNGYVIEKNGQRLYLAGDTAGIAEMRALTNIDIALIPMNPPFTMTVEEAAEAVLAFVPDRVYPYHYRTPDGLSDTAKFKSLVNAGNANIDVVVLNWYPTQQ